MLHYAPRVASFFESHIPYFFHYIDHRAKTDDEARFKLLGNALYSQAQKHAAYGGVYPSLAKREHAKNLVPLLRQCLKDADLLAPATEPLSPEHTEELATLLAREEGLFSDSWPTLLAILKALSEQQTSKADHVALLPRERPLWLTSHCVPLLVCCGRLRRGYPLPPYAPRYDAVRATQSSHRGRYRVAARLVLSGLCCGAYTLPARLLC